MVPFTRQLGPRSGIQLNPLLDNSERAVSGNADQTFAVVGRFERGRIDKAFRVNRSNLQRLLGTPSSLQVSALNEAFVHIYDTLQNGGYEAVVYRLNVAGATNNFLVVSDALLLADALKAEAVPTAGYAFTLKHLECFNDGIVLEVNADKTFDVDGITPIASKMVNVRLRDSGSNEILYEFSGSLDPTAKDDFGQSIYLTDVVAMLTDNLECVVAASADIATTAIFYGLNGDGTKKWATASLAYFTEGGTAYELTDYDRACAALKYGDHSFGYMIGGGTRAVPLLSKMILLGKDINKQFAWDVPGEYTVEQAIAFVEQLSVDTHYSQAYWAPLKSDDPVNGGKAYLGTSCINIGKRCLRNASTDSNGIPPMNWVVAGKEFPLERTGIIQVLTPTEQELDDLARAKINPVLFQRYADGGKYVFVDSLTGAKTEADRKLIAVADMSSRTDDLVTQFAQGVMQKPMKAAIKMTTDFMQKHFEALETAEWIKPSKDLDGAAFAFTVAPNGQRPSDRLDVSYWLKYDGTVRAIYVQQTISR